MGGYAWVTLATNDAYSLGALVLAHSLRRVGTKHELAVLITPGVTQTMKEKLSSVFSVVMEVSVFDSRDEANLALLARPELGVTFTKLHCWRLTQYEKCVFLDADTLVVRNCDELFEREELSAAPDVGWPDCFNSGVFVYKPSQQTFASITAFAAARGSFDGGDQGLLNMYFSDWATKDISKHLPFIYNMCSTATYSYLPAFKQFGDDVRIIHFIGISKPWLQYFDTLTGIVQPPVGSTHLQPLLQLWWNIFCEKVHPQLSSVMGGLAGALAQMTLGEPRSAEQTALEEHMRKQSWEQGHIDYMGRDSFDNIWKKICETLALAPTRLPSPPKETGKAAKITTDKTDESVESSEIKESIDETDKQSAQATTNRIEEQSLVTNVPTTNVPKLLEETEEIVDVTSSAEKKEDISEKLLEKPVVSETLDKTSDKEIAELSTTMQSCSIKKAIDEPKSNIETVDLETVEQSEQTKIKNEKRAKELSTASEILTVSPVPIQVAESVLQVEPKESTSDSQMISQQVLSSTVTPVHSTEAKDKVAINGSTTSIDSVRKESISAGITTAKSIDTANKSSELLTKPRESSQISLPVEQSVVESQPVETPILSSESLETSERVPESKTSESCVMKESGTEAASIEAPKNLPSSKAPTRPSRPKELSAASTSASKTVPQDKAIKKPVKKPAEKTIAEGEPVETIEGDDSEKKAAKKVVKKVTKKPKTKSEEMLEETTVEDNSSASKQKKTVKVVKKGTKSSQTSDATVPETPTSSSIADAPVPPKRKTKTATAKSITKKPDVEE